MGCAAKNYSRTKPKSEELVGTWVLSSDSRGAVQAKINSHLAATDGVLIINTDGSADASGLPVSPEFTLRLFSGSGRWLIEETGGIWKLALHLSKPGTADVIHANLDIGRDEATYLNQAIDDPDGEVMRFYRSSGSVRD